ncbi:unnamed protein product [Durusdinium trenchii]|uniref:Uncharacterized protein n=1 Tax=Durusdinium trenchii TaxID=1381693 RepID=A0ABP0R9W5_9DINO
MVKSCLMTSGSTYIKDMASCFGMDSLRCTSRRCQILAWNGNPWRRRTLQLQDMICAVQDHSAPDCQFVAHGVVLRSVQMEDLDRARRWALVEKALEQQGLGSLMTMRWYKKEKLDTGLLYMRLSSAELAQELIAMEVLDLGGEKAKVFPITKSKTKQNSKKPMHVTPVPKVEPELSSRREPARPCFLCDGAAGGHQAFQCPFWRQCVTIKGASEENREEIWERCFRRRMLSLRP